MQELGSAATNDLRDAKGGRETMMQDLVAAEVHPEEVLDLGETKPVRKATSRAWKFPKIRRNKRKRQSKNQTKLWPEIGKGKKKYIERNTYKETDRETKKVIISSLHSNIYSSKIAEKCIRDMLNISFYL